MKTRFVTAAAIAVAAGATAAQTSTFVFDGVNHPNGNVDDQEYGLRLDNFGGEAPTTFSFEDQTGSRVTVSLEVQSTVQGGGQVLSGAATLSISGTIFANSASGGTDFGSFLLDATYDGFWDASTNQFLATPSDAFTGSLTGLSTTGASPIGDGDTFAMTAKPRGDGSTMLFGDNINGSRRDPGDDRLEGFGWVESPESSGTQDFLFLVDATGGDVPTPAGAAVLGLARAIGETMAVAMVTPAEGPSLGTAPAGTWM